MVRTLFVCMGNICRSPMATGMFVKYLSDRDWQAHVSVDSAGTHDFHLGKPPDPRARAAAARRGVEIGGQRARRIRVEDFEAFDYIIAMDRANLEALRAICPPVHRDKLFLLLDFVPELGEREVPDPYYGSAQGFDRVLDLVEMAAEGLFEHLRSRHPGLSEPGRRA